MISRETSALTPHLRTEWGQAIGYRVVAGQGRKGGAAWAQEKHSHRQKDPWPGVTSTGRRSLGVQGGTTGGSPPGRAEEQEEETEVGLRPPCVRKGTGHISLGGGGTKLAQVLEVPRSHLAELSQQPQW